MDTRPASREVSLQRIRAAARVYDRQKQLAQELGTTDSTLSKYLNEQLPRLCELLDLLGLEVVPQGHLADLRRVLKETL